MAKLMSIFGMVSALLLATAFGLDLVLGTPFGGANAMIDICFLVGGLILAYMGWNAFRSAG